MEQDVRSKNAGNQHISGTWAFDSGFVTLKPCLAVRLNSEGSWAGACISGVDVGPLGRINISIDSQHGLAYGRINEP